MFWTLYNNISVTCKSVDCGKVVNLVAMITLITHPKIGVKISTKQYWSNRNDSVQHVQLIKVTFSLKGERFLKAIAANVSNSFL